MVWVRFGNKSNRRRNLSYLRSCPLGGTSIKVDLACRGQEEGAADELVRGQVLGNAGNGSDAVVVGAQHGVVREDSITLAQGLDYIDQLKETEIDKADIVADKEVLLAKVANQLGQIGEALRDHGVAVINLGGQHDSIHADIV